MAVQKSNSPMPMITPAIVRLPICHAFGAADGRTLSVVSDMPRKSPVIMIKTISKRRQDRMAGHEQADRQKQHLHGFLGDGVQRVAEDALKRNSPFSDRSDDAGEPGLGQHHAGRRFGDVSRGRDGDPHLGLAQCRRIIGAVAAHADRVAALLECFDEFVLVLRQDAGEDRELLGMDGVGDRPGRADGAIESHRLRDDGCRRRRIARHHHGADAQAVQFADRAPPSLCEAGR